MTRKSEQQSVCETLQALAKLEEKSAALRRTALRLRSLRFERDAAQQELKRLEEAGHQSWRLRFMLETSARRARAR